MRKSFITEDVLRKIKQVEIHTRRLLRGTLMGDARSAQKGSGLDFDQIREYQHGDDIRFIDWKSSARLDSVLVKQYIEERSRVVLLAVDVSGSSFFGSTDTLKHDIIAQIASVLAFMTNTGKDLVGLILFAQDVELYIPPGRGRAHVHTIMEHVFGYKPVKKTTNITSALKKLAQLKRRDAIAFIISDFIDDTIDDSYLSLVSNLYECIALRCLDRREHELPAAGFIPVEDPETGEHVLLDMRKHKLAGIKHFLKERIEKQNQLFRRRGVRVVDLPNHESFIGDLIRFFRRRMQY